ncbi:MAG: acetylglutamate kinase [Deltaproteobacteria bacterium]|jgi:acetylglutamate kinase|nr:MAG: acetylglutamate kinase [Deltaproteobacteria bacterium]
MEKLIDKAEVLIEALPYIRRFYNKTIVIKYGGHAMVDNDLKVNFALDVILMKYVGFNPIIVHGGGPQIGKVLEKMGKPSKFIDGMRVTDLETMDIVEMVLVGKINKEIVGLINHHGGQAVGLSGKDGRLIMAKKLDIIKQKNGTDAPEIIDIGMVGEVESINPNVIEALDRNKFIPVIAPIGIGNQGETYNINADLVAGKIASALRAEKMVLLTDVEGLLDGKKRLISTIDSKKVRKYIKDGIISEGMIPKVTCCLDALTEGVVKTHIIDGRVKHALLLEVFTDVGVGTEIVM